MNIETLERRQRAARLVSDLVSREAPAGRNDALRELFNAHGARAPVVLWTPRNDELQNPLLRRFAEICRGWADARGHVPEARFDAGALGPLRDWLMRLEVEQDDLRYLEYGPQIVDHYGQDMTGRSVGDIGGHIAEFFEALYRAAAERGEWVLSEHEPPRIVFVRSWRRLIVPLFGPDGETVTRFAVLNVPENELRDGLELITDPVFVTDGAQRIRYANAAAQTAFGLPPVRPRAPSLREVVGFGIENAPGPDALLAERDVCESVQLAFRGGIGERLIMTVSAAEHRGAAYYVVVLRPAA